MAELISLLLLAFALSLDSFNVGFTYGLRKMKIPFKSIVIVAFCTGVVLLAAMAIGNILEEFFTPQLAESIGGVILVVLGAWVLFQFFRPEKVTDQEPSTEKTIINLEIKSLGIVINILKKPLSADFDQSGTITGIEAFMLGIALSLDAFGAGIGAAMLGYSPVLLAMSAAAMSFLFVSIGMKIGGYLASFGWMQKLAFIPGLLLICIGIWKL